MLLRCACFSLQPSKTYGGSIREVVLLADCYRTCLIVAYPNPFMDSDPFATDILLKPKDCLDGKAHLENPSALQPAQSRNYDKKAEPPSAASALAAPEPTLADRYAENGEFTKAAAEHEKLLNTGTNPDWVRWQVVHLTRQSNPTLTTGRTEPP